MSLFNEVNVACPHCATEFVSQRVASINADRRPDLRQEILDGTFQALACPSCDVRFRLPPGFTYIDVGRGQWIMAHPADSVEHWPVLEGQAGEIFGASYGRDAPQSAREIGAELTARITFGWPAIREKLLCVAFGLDDLALELTKAAVMRNVPKPPFTDQSELRLVDVPAGTLQLAWLNRDTEATLASVEVPRDVFTAVAGDTASWVAMRDQLAGHNFTDLDRLLVIPLAA